MGRRAFSLVFILLLTYMGGSGLLARRLPGRNNRPTLVVVRRPLSTPRCLAILRRTPSEAAARLRRPRGILAAALGFHRILWLGSPDLLARGP